MVRVIDYEDPVEHCSGFLVYNGTECRLAAGGCRMAADLDADTLRLLASRMTLKQRVLGVNVDGAKCGIAYDPAGPERLPVLRRFIAFLRDELSTRFSMGCDMGTNFEELDGIARELGIGSVKIAIRAAQRISGTEFDTRMALLNTSVGRLTLGQRRAGHGLASAVTAAAVHGGRSLGRMTVSLQGFGNLGRGAALALLEKGIKIVAIADVDGCVVDSRGLDVARMLSMEKHRPVPTLLADTAHLPTEELFNVPTDVIILAAGGDAMAAEQAASLPVPIVVVGANHGLSSATEQLLVDRGVIVVPDFIGGIGGSASMEALFGPESHPTAAAVLANIESMMRELLDDVLTVSRDRGRSVRQVGYDIAATAPVDPRGRPYGISRYRATTRARQGNRHLVTTSKQLGEDR